MLHYFIVLLFDIALAAVVLVAGVKVVFELFNVVLLDVALF